MGADRPSFESDDFASQVDPEQVDPEALASDDFAPQADPEVLGVTEVSPAKPRRARRKQHERVAESDRRMLAAAMQLIGERGYRGTSLAAVGQAAGYSRGLVHERFGSKQGLLWALTKQILRAWNQESRALRPERDCAQTGLEALCDLLDHHRRAVEEDRGIRTFYALMFEALGPTPELLPEMRALHQRFRADIERLLRQGIADKTVRADVDPSAQAALLMATQRGIAFQWLLDPQAFSLKAAYDEHKRNLRRMLAP